MSEYLNRYETRSQASTQSPPAQHGDYQTELGGEYDFEDGWNSNDGFEAPLTPAPVELSKQEALQIIKEKAVKLRDSRDFEGLKDLQNFYRQISKLPDGRVPSPVAAALPQAGGAVDSDLGLEGLLESEGGEEIRLSSLRKELDDLKSSVEGNPDLPEYQKEEFLEKLGKWSSSLDLHPSEDSLEAIREGMESIKRGEDPEVDAQDEIGMTPSRVEKGIRYFESKYGQLMDLTPLGKGTENVVSTSGEVTITPQNPKAPVLVSQEGGFFIVRVRDGEKEDVFKVKNIAAKLNIQSENVSGDLENEDGIVTAGSKGEKYISPERLVGFAATLREGISKIPSKYRADGEDETRDVKAVLEKMASALEATDPKEKAEFWEEAVDEVAAWLNTDQLGQANDRAAVLCWVLHGEFGEKGFKKLLKDGIIPREFAVKVGEVISAKADELFRDGYYPDDDQDNPFHAHGEGSLGWNHKMYLDFLEKNSKPSN